MSRNRRGIALVSRWVLVSMLALFPIASHALALGKLKVLSALNEPLNAEIDFTSVTDKELKGLAVTLASRADFDAAGVDRPSFLSQIKFMVSRRLDGRYFLQLRTDEQINEPFLHLLLQVDWPGGRLVREYTALIDPPYQIASKPAPVETPVVTPPAPEAVVEPAPTAAAPAAEAPKEETPPAVTAQAEAAKAPEQQPAAAEAKTPEQPKTAEETPPTEEAAKQEAAAPAQTAPGEVQPLGPPDVSAAAQGATPEESTTPKVEPLEAKPKAETPPAPEPAAPAPVAAPTWAAMSEYDVKKGDTLWRVADKARGSNQDMTIEQVMLAIYRTNKNAFFGNNVNNLKAGKILKMPEREEVQSLPAPQARHEFRAQYDAWQEYKLKLAAAAGAVKVTEAPEAAPSGAEEKPAEKPAAPAVAKKAEATPSKPAAPTAAGKGRQDELLKIVRSTLEQQKTTPEKGVTDKEAVKESAAQERQALADRAAALDESLESKRMENKDLSEKVGIVRSQLKKESRLIALENESLAQQTKKPSETKPAEAAAKPVEKPAVTPPPQKAQLETAPAPVPEKPKPTPIAPKKRVAPPPAAAPKEEKGFLATVLEAVQGDLLMPVLIGVVVLLSGGLALVYFRRRQKSIAEFEESILSADAISTEQPATTGTVAAQQPAVTTGGDTSFLSDFSQGGMGNIHTDEVDPVAEAEVYLAYGRDETAEEILKDAVVKNPDRHELKLKLLEIYHQRNDVSAFETLAEELYAALGGRGGKIWEKVEEMGRKLNPDNPMFRGGAPAKAPAAKPATAAKPAIAMPGMAAAAESAKTEMAGVLDFDVETPAAGKTAAEPAFDLDFGAPKTAAADTEEFVAAAPASAKGGSDFESLDLGAPADNALDLNMSGKSETGGDLNFDASAADNEIKWEPTPAAEAEVDLAAAAPAGEAPASGQWDETATKLDLAKAYIDMGDAEGARSILQEVMTEGSEAQKKQAQELSTQIA